jgi:hypothetical protein
MLHLWWAKWYWDRFFSQYLGFPLSVSFHQRFIYMLLLAECQTGEGWELSHKQRSSVNRGATDRRELSLFFSRFTSSVFMLGSESRCPRVSHYLYISKVCANNTVRCVFQTIGSGHRLALNQARTYECRNAKPCTTACGTALYTACQARATLETGCPQTVLSQEHGQSETPQGKTVLS